MTILEGYPAATIIICYKLAGKERRGLLETVRQSLAREGLCGEKERIQPRQEAQYFSGKTESATGHSFASPSSAGPSTGSMWCLGKAFLEGQTTRMQSCMLPPEPIRAAMIGPTWKCWLVLTNNNSYLEIDTAVIARLGVGGGWGQICQLGISSSYVANSGWTVCPALPCRYLVPALYIQFLCQTGILSWVLGHKRENKQMEYINSISFLRPFADIS